MIEGIRKGGRRLAGRIALVVPMALLGCGTTTTHAVVTGAAAAPHSGTVQVLMGEAPLPAGHVEVAIVQAIGHGTNADMAHVIEGLRAKAAALGCTIVARVKVDQGSTMSSGTGVCLRPGS